MIKDSFPIILVAMFITFSERNIFAESAELKIPRTPVGEKQSEIKKRATLIDQTVKISGLRAVLIVGDVDGDSGRTTLQYIKNLKDVATLLRSRGVAVKEFYSPDNSWEKIRSAADGANFVIYSGHGVGSNLDKPPYKQSTVGGFALKNKFVSNEDVASTLHPAKGAIVIFLGACFTAGNMAYDMGVIGDEEAISRISMYSKPFLNAGFGGYYATWAPWTAQGVIARLFGSENFGSSYLDEADISGVKKLSHPQDSSSALWYQKAKQNGQTVYNYAFVGYPDKDLTSLFGDEKTESKKTDENKSPEISEAEKLNLNQNLLYSIYTKNAKDAAEYLKKGADPNSEQEGWTAIHMAVYYDLPETVRLLILLKANLNKKVGGFTPIALAEAYEKKQIAGILEEAGANKSRAFGLEKPVLPKVKKK